MGRTILSVVGLAVIVMALAVMPASAQTPSGVSVTCNTGANITNGVEIVVNMRSGFTYTATAIGINGFDPVLAVLDASGNGLCNDDDAYAASYSANLPTTGFVPASNLSSQVFFSNNQSGLTDVSLVVGGYNGARGEFVVILEGMAVTSNDGAGALAGDPFSVVLTPNVVNSGKNLTAYMISLNTQLDPYINVLTNTNALVYQCDDAGTTSCNGASNQLNGYYITSEDGQLPGYELDSMITVSPASWAVAGPAYTGGIRYLMTSYAQSTFGEYLVAFHMAN